MAVCNPLILGVKRSVMQYGNLADPWSIVSRNTAKLDYANWSLVELTQPPNVLVPIVNPRHGYPQCPSRQPARPASSRYSLTSVVKTVSRLWSPPQIPPLDFDEETFWPPGQFISPEPLLTPGGSSVHSESLHDVQMSIDSGVGQSTRGSQCSITGYQPTARSSILSGLTTPGPLSPLDVALTTRVSIWKTSGRQAGVIKTATMEGLIHYLLLKSLGE